MVALPLRSVVLVSSPVEPNDSTQPQPCSVRFHPELVFTRLALNTPGEVYRVGLVPVIGLNTPTTPSAPAKVTALDRSASAAWLGVSTEWTNGRAWAAAAARLAGWMAASPATRSAAAVTQEDRRR